MTRLFRSVFLMATLAFAFDQAFASSVATTENKSVRLNAGVVEVPAVLVADQPGLPNSLSGVTKFSLVLSSESNVRLSRTSLVSVSVTPGISRVISVSDDLRTLSFESSVPLPSGASLSISGIKVVAYNRYSPLRGFDLDIGSDGVLEAYDPNGIRVTEEFGAQQDTTPPQEPVGLTGSFSTGTVTVTANPSGDLDFENFKVSFEDASGTSLWNTVQSSLVAKQFDLVSNTDVVRVQSVDKNGNLSVGVLLRKSSVEAVSSTGSTSGSGASQSSTGSVTVPVVETSTGTAVSTGSVATGSVALEPVYVPTYRSSGLSGMIAGMDAFIASHEGSKTYVESEKAAVRIIRNDLAKYFESFFKTRVGAKKRLLIGQIRAKAAVLKDVILK